MTDAPLTEQHWKTLGLVLLGLLASFVAGLWWLFGGFDAPRDSGLDPVYWRNISPGQSGRENPRRDMAQSARRWLNSEHPSREQVRALLGQPDSSGATEDAWEIGCFTEYAFCTDGNSLVVVYPGGRASSRIESY